MSEFRTYNEISTSNQLFLCPEVTRIWIDLLHNRNNIMFASIKVLYSLTFNLYVKVNVLQNNCNSGQKWLDPDQSIAQLNEIHICYNSRNAQRRPVPPYPTTSEPWRSQEVPKDLLLKVKPLYVNFMESLHFILKKFDFLHQSVGHWENWKSHVLL